MVRHNRRPRRLLAEINVVPYIDVMLVLLVIFMVTAPMLQRGTDVQLPQAQHSDVKEQDRLTLTVAHDGRIYLNNEEVPKAQLLARITAATKDREKSVQFRGDAKVMYGLVIEIMDTLKAAGIENVGMITERPSPRP